MFWSHDGLTIVQMNYAGASTTCAQRSNLETKHNQHCILLLLLLQTQYNTIECVALPV